MTNQEQEVENKIKVAIAQKLAKKKKAKKMIFAQNLE